MFDKFSEEAIRVLVHAQEEARNLKHKYVGAEHLLLGVIAADSGCMPLDHSGRRSVNLNSLREAVAKLHKKGTKASPKELPFDEDAQAVLRRSFENSKHNVIYPNHILLALFDVPGSEKSVAVPVLKEMRLDPNELRIPVVYQTYFGENPQVSDGSEMTEAEAKELCIGISNVVSLALEEAIRLRQNFVGTEMMLLGLLRAEGSPAAVLEKFGVTLEETRKSVEEAVWKGGGMVMIGVRFTPRAKRLLKASLEEAHKTGSDTLNARHLLLGLTFEKDGLVWQIFREKNVDIEALRAAVLALFEETR